MHLDVLGTKDGRRKFFYRTYEDLKRLLLTFRREEHMPAEAYSAYAAFAPDKVMATFEKVYLGTAPASAMTAAARWAGLVQLQVQRRVPAVADPEDPFLRAGTAARSPARPIVTRLRRAYPRTDVERLSDDPRQCYRLRKVDQLMARTTRRFLCAAT